MSNLASLRALLYKSPKQETYVGNVLSILPSGVISVALSSSVVACTSAVPVSVGDTVRVRGFVITARLVVPQGGVPVYRA